MEAEELVIKLRTIMDINDVKTNVGQIQNVLSKLKLPNDLKSSFEDTFKNFGKEIEGAQQKLKNGFKTPGDLSNLKKSFNSIDTLYEKLIEDINKIDDEDIKASITLDTKPIKDAEKEMENLRNSISQKISDKAGIGDLTQEVASLQKAAGTSSRAWSNFAESLKSGDINQAKTNLQSVISNLKSFKMSEEMAAQSGGILQSSIADVNQKIAEGKYSEAAKKMEDVDAAIDLCSSGYKDGGEHIKLYAEKIKNLIDILSKASEVTDIDEMAESVRQMGINIEGLKAEQIKQIFDIIKGLRPELEKNQKSWQDYSNNIGNAASQTQNFANQLSQLGKRAENFVSLTNGVNLFKRALKSAFETVKELDKSMTETAVVTNFSVGDMWDKLPEYTKVAQQYGSTIKDAYDVMTIFYQQGLDTNQAFALGTQTMQMARIAGLDYADAADKMTNALRGFNMELTETSAQRVNDVYSELAAISASDTNELSTAMTKVASLANSANMEFENTSAFLAQMIETTRESAETAGTALKTVVARFAEVKELYSEGDLTGTTEDGEEVNINKVGAALRAAGIDLNEFMTGAKGLDDILLELSGKWDSLDLLTQRYIATMAAGSRQQSRFLALMSDNERLTELTTAAYNAQGASSKQFAKTQESLETKLNNLKTAWQTFLMGIENSEVIKRAVDLLTGFLNKLNDFLNQFGSTGKSVASVLMSLISLLSASFLTRTITGALDKIFTGGTLSAIKKKATGGGTEVGKKFAESMANKIKTSLTKNGSRTILEGLKASAPGIGIAVAGLVIGAALTYIGAKIANYIRENTDTGRANKEAKQAANTAESLSDAYDRVKTKLEDLTNATSVFQEQRNAMAELTEGTLEWREALASANEKAVELIENYGSLADDSGNSLLEYEILETGEISISEESLDRLEEALTQQEKNTKANSMIATANANYATSKAEYTSDLTEKAKEIDGDNKNTYYDQMEAAENFKWNASEGAAWAVAAGVTLKLLTGFGAAATSTGIGAAIGIPLMLAGLAIGATLVAESAKDANEEQWDTEEAKNSEAYNLYKAQKDAELKVAEEQKQQQYATAIQYSDEKQNEYSSSYNRAVRGIDSKEGDSMDEEIQSAYDEIEKNLKENSEEYEEDYKEQWAQMQGYTYSKFDKQILDKEGNIVEIDESQMKHDLAIDIARTSKQTQAENINSALVKAFGSDANGNLAAQLINGRTDVDLSGELDLSKVYNLSPEELSALGYESVEGLIEEISTNYANAVKAQTDQKINTITTLVKGGIVSKKDENYNQILETIGNMNGEDAAAFADQIDSIALNDNPEQMKTYLEMLSKYGGEVANLDMSNAIAQYATMQELAEKTNVTLSESALPTVKQQFDDLLTTGLNPVNEQLDELIENNGKITSKNVKDLAKQCDTLDQFLKNGALSAQQLAQALTLYKNGTLELNDFTESVIKFTTATETAAGILSSNSLFASGFDPGTSYSEMDEWYRDTIVGGMEGLAEKYDWGDQQFENYLYTIFDANGTEFSTNRDIQKYYNLATNWEKNGGKGFWNMVGSQTDETGKKYVNFDSIGNWEELTELTTNQAIQRIKDAAAQAGYQITDEYASSQLTNLLGKNKRLADAVERNDLNAGFNALFEEGNTNAFINEDELAAMAKSANMTVDELKDKIEDFNNGKNQLHIVSDFSYEDSNGDEQDFTSKEIRDLVEGKAYDIYEETDKKGITTTRTDRAHYKGVETAGYQLDTSKFKNGNYIDIDKLEQEMTDKHYTEAMKESVYKAYSEGAEQFRKEYVDENGDTKYTEATNTYEEALAKYEEEIQKVNNTKLANAIAEAFTGLEVSVDSKSVTKVTKELKNVTTNNGKGYDVSVNIDQEAITNAIKAGITGANNQTITVKTTLSTEGEYRGTPGAKNAIGTGHSFNRYATGNKGSRKDELALVGELGPELIQYENGGAYLAGENGPEMTRLSKGDIVYPNKATKEIFKGQKNKSQYFNRYARGKVPSDAVIKNGKYDDIKTLKDWEDSLNTYDSSNGLKINNISYDYENSRNSKSAVKASLASKYYWVPYILDGWTDNNTSYKFADNPYFKKASKAPTKAVYLDEKGNPIWIGARQEGSKFIANAVKADAFEKSGYTYYNTDSNQITEYYILKSPKVEENNNGKSSEDGDSVNIIPTDSTKEEPKDGETPNEETNNKGQVQIYDKNDKATEQYVDKNNISDTESSTKQYYYSNVNGKKVAKKSSKYKGNTATTYDINGTKWESGGSGSTGNGDGDSTTFEYDTQAQQDLTNAQRERNKLEEEYNELKEGGLWTSLLQLKNLEKQKEAIKKQYSAELKLLEAKEKDKKKAEDELPTGWRLKNYLAFDEEGQVSWTDKGQAAIDSGELSGDDLEKYKNYVEAINNWLDQKDKLEQEGYELDEINDEEFQIYSDWIDFGVEQVNKGIDAMGKLAQSAIQMIEAVAQSAIDGFNSYLGFLTIKFDDEHDIGQLDNSLSNVVDRLTWEYEKLLKKKIGYDGTDAMNQRDLFENSNESAKNISARMQNQRRLYENSFRQLEDLGMNISSELTEAFEKLYDALYGSNGPFTRLNKSINNFKGQLEDVLPNTTALFGQVKGILGNIFSQGEDRLAEIMERIFPYSIIDEIADSIKIEDYQLGDFGRSNLQKIIQLFSELTPSFNADYQIANKAELVDALNQKMSTIITNDTITAQFVQGYLDYLTEVESQMESEVENIRSSESQILDMYDSLTEILERGKEEYNQLGQDLYDAIVDEKNSLIEELSALNENITQADSDILETLKNNLQLIRQQRSNDKEEKDLQAKEARLAYLRQDTSGSNLQEIRKLEQELEDGQESYTDKLIDQKISELESQNQNAADQRQVQIDLLQEEINNTQGIWETVEKLLKGISKFDNYLTGEINREGYKAIIEQLRSKKDYKDSSQHGKDELEEGWNTEIRAASLYRQVQDNLGDEYKYLKLANSIIDRETGLPKDYAANEGWHNYVGFSTLEQTIDRNNTVLKEAVTAINNLVEKITISYDDEQSLHMKMTYYGGLIQGVSGAEYAATKAIEDLASNAPGVLTQLTTGAGNIAKGILKAMGGGIDSIAALTEDMIGLFPDVFGSGVDGGGGVTRFGDIGQAIGFLVEGFSNFAAAAVDAASMGMNMVGDMSPGFADIGVAVATALKETFFNDYEKVNAELEDNINVIIDAVGNTLGTSGYLKEIRDGIQLAKNSRMGQPDSDAYPIYDTLLNEYKDIMNDYKDLLKKDTEKTDIEGFNKIYSRVKNLKEVLSGFANFDVDADYGENLEMNSTRTLEAIQKWRGEIGVLFGQIDKTVKDEIRMIVDGILSLEGKTIGNKNISRWIDIYDAVLMLDASTGSIQRLASAMEEYEPELANKFYKLFDQKYEQEHTPQESFISFWNHKLTGIWGDVSDFFSGFWDKIKTFFEQTAIDISGKSETAANTAFGKIKDYFENGYIEDSKSPSGILNKIWNWLKDIFESIRDWFDTLTSKSTLLENIKNATEGITGLFTSFFTNIKEKISLKSNIGIKQLFGFLKEIFEGTLIPTNSYATGGSIRRNETALVGEAGTELIQHANGGATLASGPSMAKLQKGDIVYNARQTKDILKGNKLDFRRFAEGTMPNLMIQDPFTIGFASFPLNIPDSSENNKGSTFNLNLNLEDLTVDSPDRVEQVADRVMDRINRTVSSAIWPYNKL